MKTITNKFKIAMVAVGILAIGTANAQTDPTVAADVADPSKTGRAAASGESIRLIDNKGTIKYMQANNGITTITSTAPGNRTTTTWQLGGTLTEDTFIDASGAIFAITGVKAIDPTVDAAAAISDIPATSFAAGSTGFSIVVRDEVTGETKKILASDLLKVQGVRVEDTATADSTTNLDITVRDMLATVSLFKVSVYRNGAKLRAGTDYVLGANVVTLQPQGIATAPNDWEIYDGDFFEIHWIK